MVQESVFLPGLPLAVYRELAAHLRQLPGVVAEVVMSGPGLFDYQASQVKQLIVRYQAELSQQVDQILDYYGDRYCGGRLERQGTGNGSN